MAAMIRHGWCGAILLMVLAGSARGQTALDSLPPTPAPPAATGALLVEAFHRLDAWKPDRDSVWFVKRGVLTAVIPDKPQERSMIFAGSADWKYYALDVDLLQWRGADKGVLLNVQGQTGIGVDLRGAEYQDVLVYHRQLPLGHAAAPNPDRQWHHLRVESRGGHYTILVDGKQVLTCHDKLAGARNGRIGLAAYAGGKGVCTVFYANVVVTQLAEKH
jgi:hypothetical protein